MQIEKKMFFKYNLISIENVLKILIALAIIPNILGFFPTLMDQDDNTLYANIAKTIVEKNDWMNLYVNGRDWLDKPHFQFWITAIFYKFFGFNQFAYRFSSKQYLQDSFFVVQSFPNYSVSKLNIKFLNHATRTDIVDSVYIMSNKPVAILK